MSDPKGTCVSPAVMRAVNRLWICTLTRVHTVRQSLAPAVPVCQTSPPPRNELASGFIQGCVRIAGSHALVQQTQAEVMLRAHLQEHYFFTFC